MGKYICRICGKEFDRVGNGVYCAGPHYRPCPVCGKPVAYHLPSESVKCCSDECVNILSERSKQKHSRVCEECGKVFFPKQATQKYCLGPHVSTCVICGREFEYTCRPTEKPKTCSRICQEKLRSVTAQQRYGVDNVSQLSFVKQKISERNRSEDVVAKRVETNLKRWGVDNPAKNPEISKKLSEIMSSEDYLTRREQTCLEKYGTASPMQTDAVKAKRAQTCIERYGCEGHPHSVEDFAKMIKDGHKVEAYLRFKEDPKAFIECTFSEPPTISQLENMLGVTDTPIYNTLIEHNCQDMLKHSFSTIEDEVCEFLYELDPNIEIKRNDRTIIKPLEVDIYLPEYSIGIECNPAATHNSSVTDPWGQQAKHYKYHQQKSTAAEQAGIFLFHIFGYEWVNNRPIIKSMIRNLLGKNEFHIGARETYVCQLTGSEFKKFLDENHRQKYTVSAIMLGLKRKSDDLLVSVMSFNHLRATMGKTADTSNTWELSRFCNLCNYTVNGSASKLFKYFLNNYHPESVVSFSDIAHTRGNLYSQLGFTETSRVDPGYVWSDIYDNKYYTRVSCQKRFLKKLFHDESIDVEHKTEREIMEEHKFVRVYDCGLVKWTYIQNA